MGIEVNTSIQYVKGVGPKLGSFFQKKGIHSVKDLLEYYPRSYEDHRAARSISSLKPLETVSLIAHVRRVSSMNMGRSRKKIYEILVHDSTGSIACKYFRIPFKGYFNQFNPEDKVQVTGKVTSYRNSLEFHHPELHHFKKEDLPESKLVPVYSETEGLRPAKLRKIIQTALDDISSPLTEVLPSWILKKYSLLKKQEALQAVHNPPLVESDLFLSFQSQSQKRIIFDEFFWLELLLAQRKYGVRKEFSPPMKKESFSVDQFIKNLAFKLTEGQEKAYKEIKTDLQSEQTMNRLIQGDVGCGKTVVAFMSAIHAINNGFQVALMVPTEVLAEQHYQNALKWLSPLGIQTRLLTGQLKESEHKKIATELMSGHLPLCIGTHALIQNSVDFKNLGLAIIDEQHRFGVEQRDILKKKGQSPNFLLMTATPIPRTLAMTAYGDLDISVIRELPKGRSPVITRKVFENKRPQVIDFLCKQIENGRQAYFVYPLVEESEKMDLKDAQTAHKKISSELPNFKVGLLHGKMKSDEKEKIMKDFRNKKIDILVATTIIEVGIDVPNANFMVIEQAERFGLSQLHQLRGRVGRGSHKSYCVLILGYAVSEEGRQRASIMESTMDGFKIAEADLEMRGPGEFLGKKQSGLSGFKMAHLIRDIEILEQARKAAFEIIDKDPELKKPEHELLAEELKLKTEYALS